MTNDNFSRRQFLKAGGIGLLGALALARTHAWSDQDRELHFMSALYTTGKSEGIYRLSHGPGDRRTDAIQLVQVSEPVVPHNRSKQTLPVCRERSGRVSRQTRWWRQCICDRPRNLKSPAAE